jgi:hypothetical protein
MSLELYNQKRQAAHIAGAFVAINMAKTLVTDLLVRSVVFNRLDEPVIDLKLRDKLNDATQGSDAADKPVVRQEFLMSYAVLSTPGRQPVMGVPAQLIPETNKIDAVASVAVYNHSYDTVVHIVMYVPRLQSLINAGNSLSLDKLLYRYQPTYLKSVLTDTSNSQMAIELDDVSVGDKGTLYVFRHPLTATSFAINLVSSDDSYQKFRSKFAKSLVELPSISEIDAHARAIEDNEFAMHSYCRAVDEFNRAALPAGYGDIAEEDLSSVDEFINSLLYDEDRLFSDLLSRDVGVRLLAAECGLDCNISSYDFELANKLQLARYLTICLDNAALENPVPEIPEWATYLTHST